MRLGWRRYHFIAQPGIERQVFLQPDIILNIGAEQSLTHSINRRSDRFVSRE